MDLEFLCYIKKGIKKVLKKKILLLGGLGFIGKNLYIQLCKMGYQVDIFSNISLNTNDVFNAYLNPKNLLIGDIRDKKYMEALVPNYSAIYCLAGLSGAVDSINRPLLDNEINCVGHLNLLEACRKYNREVILVFPSTRLVYGKPCYLPVDEKHRLNPESFYAIHKITAEYYYLIYNKLYNLRSIVLRISNPYGPFQQFGHHKYGILNWFIYLALKNKTINIFGKGLQKRDYLYIDDLINLFIMLLDTPDVFGDIYNVGYGNGISLYNSIKTIKKFIPDLSFTFSPWPKTEKEIETGDYISDITKITQKTKWRPKTDFYQGIEQTINYYKQIIE